jgi:transposase
MSQNNEQATKVAKEKAEKKYLTSFQRKLLQKSLQPNLPKKLRQRIQIMLLADEGKTQAQICQELGCCQATARHWITMAKTNQAHNWNFNPVGRPTLINEEYIRHLKQLVAQNPQEVTVPNQDCQYSFKRWTAQKLSQHLQAELGIEVTPQHLNRLLKQMGLSTRPKPTIKTNIKTKNNYHSDLHSNGCTLGDRHQKSIQIRDLETVSMLETSEAWNFNPFISN